MLGWWICIINLPPEKADELIGREARAPFELADWEAGVGGLDWVQALLKEGKATQLKSSGHPNRYTARAADVLPLIQVNVIKPPEDGIWTFGIDEGEEYALPSGWMEKPNLRLDNIRTCPSDAILTIDAWDMS
ncbi:hypothetical protein [Hydrogenophaga sp. PAMC20947]|uniref:hypothetical protein n=1 Tax=Hydrogenophaga sp. PAMC20947 TaxID=2565558 RepID=UPI00109DFB72|nr:hypothetical protein [Hydrogenophaga sp. PAMC20947]QCB47667.1 hypothetical protein E5678_17510 [Hydrogenophaga sp. PAMC20947]